MTRPPRQSSTAPWTWRPCSSNRRLSSELAGIRPAWGLRLLRWTLIDAIQHAHADTVTGAVKQRVIARRGKKAKNIAEVAAGRHLLTLVFYGMRDGLSGPQSRPVAVTWAR